MNNKELTEQEIRTRCITPAIQSAGWQPRQIREEFYTAGRMVVRGNEARRGKRKRADYVLFYEGDHPLAIVEAKDNNHPVGAGMQQALTYAADMDVPFVYTSNGDGFLEHDRSGPLAHETQLSLDQFPSPENLWQRYQTAKHLDETQAAMVLPDGIPDEIANQNTKYVLKSGDILITMTGTRGKRDYGFTAQILDSHLINRHLFLNQRVGCLKVFRPLSIELVNIFLKAEPILEQLLMTETGTANQGNIGSNALKNICFPVPPFAEQNTIVSRVNTLLQLCDDLAAHLEKAQATRTALRDAVLAM